jgi:Flp pilus assembly protein TadD
MADLKQATTLPKFLGATALMLLTLGTGCRSVPRFQQAVQVSPAQTPVTTSEAKLIGKAEPVTPERRMKVHYDLGQALEQTGKFDLAQQEYQEGLTAIVGDGTTRPPVSDKALQAKAHRLMANALDRMGRFDQAQIHYKAALGLRPDDAKTWNDIGYSHYLQGRWAEAESALRAAAKMAPKDPRIQTNLGLVLVASGRIDEALTILSQSLGGPAPAHANIGYLLASMGRTEEARVHYTEALRLQPTLRHAGLALAQLDRSRATAGSATQVAAAHAPPPLQAPAGASQPRSNHVQKTSYVASPPFGTAASTVSGARAAVTGPTPPGVSTRAR